MRWISVKERLPEKNQSVLGYWNKGSINHVIVAWDFVPKKDDEDAGFTHWMPLPEPPEPDNG